MQIAILEVMKMRGVNKERKEKEGEGEIAGGDAESARETGRQAVEGGW